MPLPVIDYSDYHRTIIGYHGTTLEAAERLVGGDDFVPSDEVDEWFGKGIYFWEHAYQQAWWWAKRKPKGKAKAKVNPAVVGAVIRLGNCFDLLDTGNIGVLQAYHKKLVEDITKAKTGLPKNVRSHRSLDCAVFNYLYAELAAVKCEIDTARAVYVPTSRAKRIYPGSWISEETHIQICVRNPKSILAVWHVRENGRYGKAAAASTDG